MQMAFFVRSLFLYVYPATEKDMAVARFSVRPTKVGCGGEQSLASLAAKKVRLVEGCCASIRVFLLG